MAKYGIMAQIPINRAEPKPRKRLSPLDAQVIGDRQLSERERAKTATGLQQALGRIEKRGDITRIDPIGRTVRWQSTG